MELILKAINSRHNSENQDIDQPDYDSVASDEDTDLETNAAKASRQKVGSTHDVDFRVPFFQIFMYILSFYSCA